MRKTTAALLIGAGTGLALAWLFRNRFGAMLDAPAEIVVEPGEGGRPQVTFWTQLASLCLTPLAVVIGVHWGIAGIAACYVGAQMIA